VIFNGAGNAGALASNERLYRLAPPDLRVRCQSRYVAASGAAFAVGAAVCAVALALSESVGWPVYTALFVGSGISRTIAGLRTDVSPSWHSPAAPPTDRPEHGLPAGHGQDRGATDLAGRDGSEGVVAGRERE
jgi:hypothetical protein